MQITSSLIVYSTNPLDYWTGMIRLSDFLSAAADNHETTRAQEEAKALFEEAQGLAEHVGWEGDFRDGPYISFLPDPTCNMTRPVIAWKQDNNGTTFIASTTPLSHLDQDGAEAAFYRRGEIATQAQKFQ